MSCRLLKTPWQGDTSYYTWPMNGTDELLLFQDHPNPASSNGTAALEESKMPWHPCWRTNWVCFLLRALPSCSRVYGTVAIYVQSKRKECGIVFVCIQLPDPFWKATDPWQNCNLPGHELTASQGTGTQIPRMSWTLVWASNLSFWQEETKSCVESLWVC